MNIRFSKPQEFVITSTQSILLFLAGVGSGKTFIIGFLSGYFIKYYPKVAGFIGANTYMQLSQSTLLRVYKVWEDIYGWVEGEDYVVNKKPPKLFDRWFTMTDYRSTISFKSGALVFIGSLDNAKAHDGKEFGWAFLDETKDSREDDVKDIILARLRGGGIYIDHTGQLTDKAGVRGRPKFKAFNPLYILTSPAKVGWINEWFKLDDYQAEIQQLIYDKENFFYLEEGDKSVAISSTYHNIDNLPEGYIDKLLANYTEVKSKMLVYGNPFVKSGGEFYSSFERMVHVKPVAFDPEKPIHISFDQNVVPYITATLHQVRQEAGVLVLGQFTEICLANPKNKTSKLCLEFIKRYGAQCSGLFYYGDPSGRKSDTRTNEHDYKIVARMLKRYLNNKSDRVPYVHPRVLKRKDFINGLFEGTYKGYRIEIDPSCKHTISDYEFVKEDKDGKKLKEKKKDPETGVIYEKYGHTSDANDYFYCEVLKSLFKKHFK